jgi:hypothetical protein
MNRIARFVPQIIVAVIMMVVARLAHVPASWMKTAPWLYSSRPLNMTAFMRIESLWIVLPTAPRRQPALIFSLCSAKITTPNAVETPKRAPQSIATGFIVSLEKLNGWNGRKTTGNHTIQRKSDNADSLLVTRLATVPILKKNRL